LGRVAQKLKNSVTQSHFQGQMTGLQIEDTLKKEKIFLSKLDEVPQSSAQHAHLDIYPRFADDLLSTDEVMAGCDHLKSKFTGLTMADRATMEVRDGIDIRDAERTDLQVMGALLRLLDSGGPLTEDMLKESNRTIQDSEYNTERNIRTATAHGAYRDVPVMVGENRIEIGSGREISAEIAKSMATLLAKVNMFTGAGHRTETTIRGAVAAHT
jgi:hypothetical protein